MLVNLLLPDLAFPRFYLSINHNEGEIIYDCQRVQGTIYNAYCIGAKIPPGEPLHLVLVSVRDDTLLAEGELSIIGLAYPTLEVATALTLTPAPTAAPTIILPTPTKKPSQSPTASYPNPPYPNPPYP
jgi:hypothetical protein